MILAKLYFVSFVLFRGGTKLIKIFLLSDDASNSMWSNKLPFTLLHSEQPKLYGVLAVLSAVGLRMAISTDPGQTAPSTKGDDFHISTMLTVRSSSQLNCLYICMYVSNYE